MCFEWKNRFACGHIGFNKVERCQALGSGCFGPDGTEKFVGVGSPCYDCRTRLRDPTPTMTTTTTGESDPFGRNQQRQWQQQQQQTQGGESDKGSPASPASLASPGATLWDQACHGCQASQGGGNAS